MANVIAENITRLKNFDSTVKMWVYEEIFKDRKLSEWINQCHLNAKYLPDVSLCENLIATTDLIETAKDATHLVFVVPHQFVEKLISQLKNKIRNNAVGISLIKGLLEEGDELKLISELIENELGIHVSVLSGANIASEIADKKFSETTIACDNPEFGAVWKSLVHCKYLKVNVVNQCIPVEICGALKNGVAISAGFVEALKCGNNTKAAVIRIGLSEIIKFCKLYVNVDDESIFYESFGVADLITTCYGGRNRLVAESYITTGKSFSELEKELLGGQKLQGPDSIKHACNIIVKKGMTSE